LTNAEEGELLPGTEEEEERLMEENLFELWKTTTTIAIRYAKKMIAQN